VHLDAYEVQTGSRRKCDDAKKGNVYFSVAVHGLPIDQTIAVEQSLAKQVIP
jgi:hypothetical protein